MRFLIALVVVAFALPASAQTKRDMKPKVLPATGAAPAGKLSPDDIKNTFFTGTPFTAATPQGIKYTMTFTPDGKITREPLGRSGVKDQGTWKLSKDGFCTTWKGSKENCYKLFAKDTSWSVSNGTSTLAIWTK